jgi:hypothetical protein
MIYLQIIFKKSYNFTAGICDVICIFKRSTTVGPQKGFHFRPSTNLPFLCARVGMSAVEQPLIHETAWRLISS